MVFRGPAHFFFVFLFLESPLLHLLVQEKGYCSYVTVDGCEVQGGPDPGKRHKEGQKRIQQKTTEARKTARCRGVLTPERETEKAHEQASGRRRESERARERESERERERARERVRECVYVSERESAREREREQKRERERGRGGGGGWGGGSKRQKQEHTQRKKESHEQGKQTQKQVPDNKQGESSKRAKKEELICLSFLF
jgi:hypothetical protein